MFSTYLHLPGADFQPLIDKIRIALDDRIAKALSIAGKYQFSIFMSWGIEIESLK